MRFDLEEGDAPLGSTCNNLSCSVVAKVRVNSREALSLPAVSYVVIEQLSAIINQPSYQLIVFDFSREHTQRTLTDLSQGLQLKLEKVDKLALVTDLGEPYYYHYDNNEVTICLISVSEHYVSDLSSRPFGTVNSKCNVHYKPLENNKVLIDPKDIISSRNISLILKDLENSPDKRLGIKIGKGFSKRSPIYKKTI